MCTAFPNQLTFADGNACRPFVLDRDDATLPDHRRAHVEPFAETVDGVVRLDFEHVFSLLA